MQFKLGPWLVFPAENKLIKLDSKEETRLEPKSMAALKLFIESPGTVITMDQFISTVWQGRVVGDPAVYRAVNQLRRKLNPEDNNAYIINIPKQGYKLIENAVLISSEKDTAIQSKNFSGGEEALINPPTSVDSINISKKNGSFVLKHWPLGLFLLVSATLVCWQLFKLPPDLDLNYKNTTPLTTDIGNELEPYFSAEGAYVAYSKQADNSRHYHLYILNVSTGKDTTVTSTKGKDSNPVLSADAQKLVFVRRNAEGCRVMLIEQPLTNQKNEIELFECGWQNMDLEITADGETLYYTQAIPPNHQHKIYTYLFDTGRSTQLTLIQNVNSQGDRIIALSPDNSKLAFLRDQDWKSSELGILDLTDYTETFYIKTGGWYHSLAWTPDNKHIIYQDSNRSLSLFSLNSRKSEKITTAFTEDILSISHNATNNDLAIGFGQKKGGIDIKSNPLFMDEKKSQLHTMLVQSTEIDAFPSFANHSKQMAFMSKRTGSAQIWLKTISGEEEQITRYTDKRSVRTIRWSPDDSKLLTEAHNSINYIDLKDNTLVTLIAENQHGSVGGATWNHDGSSIYFSSDISGDGQIYQLDITSGAIEQVTTRGGTIAFPSKDKNELYILKLHHDGLFVHNRLNGEEHQLVKEITSQLHRSIHVKPTGIYFVSTDGQIKKYDFDSLQTIDLDVGTELMSPVLTVSNDEKWFAFPYYNKVENSIFLLSQ